MILVSLDQHAIHDIEYWRILKNIGEYEKILENTKEYKENEGIERNFGKMRQRGSRANIPNT